MNKIPREFYEQNTVTVAKKLLGKKIVRKIGRQEISGIITETEAYRHKDDPASHAFRNKTERNKAMFEQVGRAYVYFTYGMYYCFNVVARHPNIDAGAVLIRAIKPEKGIKIMQKNRKISDLKNYSSLIPDSSVLLLFEKILLENPVPWLIYKPVYIISPIWHVKIIIICVIF